MMIINKLSSSVNGLIKKLKGLSNIQATFITVYIFTALMALPVVFALGEDDPVEKLFEIAPLVALSFLAMLAGVLMCWISEWLKK